MFQIHEEYARSVFMPAHVLALSFLPGIFQHAPLLAILPGFSCCQSHQNCGEEAQGLPGARGRTSE